jgi:transposase
MPRKVFTQEFKETAIRLARRPGVSVERVAHDLGIAAWTLRRWMKHALGSSRKDAGGGPAPRSADPAQRLRELEAENSRLRQERDILKKAAAFFAREADAEGRT